MNIALKSGKISENKLEDTEEKGEVMFTDL